MLFPSCAQNKKSSSSFSAKKEKVETGTKEAADNDWLAGTHAISPKKKKADNN